ncbi:amidase domain-containing protein [Mediterraneibacter gnavus]|uniref:Putative amidase domain-containing protein n=1 Tax=Mediterraneibacter gnavus (strain CC55_001C) TaxID=1073375 RepID=A0A829NN41_MEDG5|nr:amidase domain-containing protein [Mediterraneibacter gnavus]ETD20935.1 hypothetical protein HMPREF1201_00940 [Mediterraneibacter gnavus CC55_001C]QRT31011.1 amidase domain-containing protein [Mediterraneibacter gnavus]UWP63644.1 amidase domain-containing protein [Mediterraneibacter gnavus ATCC 29149]WIH31901.1 amidase domain-containing protein [Mediterraneibacter gnavus]
MKKGIALILGLTIWVSGTSTVMAEENISEVNSVYTCQNTYESRLPLEVTYDITLGEIEEDILNYIAFNKLDVVYGSDQYLELLNEFTFYPADNLDDYMIKYYSAYASVYRSTEDIKLELDKTINDIRNENIQEEIQMKKELLQIVGVEPAKVTYNVAGAQKYAADYAMVNNYKYPEYGSDCTNYASQIIHEGGGLPTTSQWNIWAGTGTLAWKSWVNVGAFCTYWGEVRGNIGNTCSTLAKVNQYAEPGDFLVWRNQATLEYEHTQFVQSKTNGEVYCSQHSMPYYNKRLNSRYTESSFVSAK